MKYLTNRIVRVSWGCLWVLLVAAIPGFGQFDSGQISGFVHDKSGAVVPGATVTATNEGNLAAQKTESNEEGYYVFPRLVVGTYTISATLQGFQESVQKGISLHAAAQLNLAIELTLGTVSQKIEVSASAPQAVALSQSTGGTVVSHEITNLEVNGRNPINLALLTPGVSGTNIGTFNPDDVSSGSFNINGGRNDAYNVFVDGAVATRTRSSGSMLGAQDIDTVQEIQVITGNYDAEYGRASSGQIRFITKSGTSQFHGSVFEALRNRKFDANTWSRNQSPLRAQNIQPPKETFNDFGFDVGGPIYIPGKWNQDHSRAFFFWAEEWVRRRNDVTQTGTVPTLAMRQGDLSELLNPQNSFFGKTRVAKDPTTGKPFQGNIILPNRISPQGQALLNASPLPTAGFQQGSANWIGSFPVSSNLRKDTFKFDYNLTAKHHLALRGTLIPWNFNDPTQGTFGLFKVLWSRPNRTGVINLTSTFSPTLLNEFSLSANSDGKGSIKADSSCGAFCERSSHGITFPFIFPGTKFANEKIPNIAVTGLTSIDNGPYPGAWAGFVYSLTDNATKIARNHTIKFGGTVEHAGQNDIIQLTTASAPQTINQNGAFRFLDSGSPNTTGLGIANALLGGFNDYTELGAKPETPWRATSLDLFAQDTWKAHSKLTLNYGIRFSLWPAWHSKWGTLAQFDPRFFDPSKAAVIDPKAGFIVSGDPFNGIVLPGSGPLAGGLARFPSLNSPEFRALYHGLPTGFQSNQTPVQPRFGVAYQLNPKTVLRGGVGIFPYRASINRDTALGGNPPFLPQVTVLNGVADNPGGTSGQTFPFIMTIQAPTNLAPAVWQYNFTLERQFWGGTDISAAYVGNRGLHLQRKRNINQLQLGTIQANLGVNPNALRPFRGAGIINTSENSGLSRYNSLQVSARKRTGSLQYSVSYTLSRSTDNTSTLTDVLPNAFDDANYYGRSDFNRTNVLVFNYVYALPFRGASNLLRTLLGNWTVSGINQFSSGTPFSVRKNIDFAGVGAGSGNQFYNQIGETSGCGTDFQPGVGATVFCKSAFAAPAPGSFGVQQRNALTNPGFWQWNLALHKDFPLPRLSESSSVQFRAEAFNVLNHPNWNGANSDPTSSSFGRVTSKDGNRNLQFQLRLSF